MITKHSIDLRMMREPCYGHSKEGGCRPLTRMHEECDSAGCPFYKPYGCKDWVRIEDRTGVNLIPPEEAYGKKKRR